MCGWGERVWVGGRRGEGTPPPPRSTHVLADAAVPGAHATAVLPGLLQAGRLWRGVGGEEAGGRERTTRGAGRAGREPRNGACTCVTCVRACTRGRPCRLCVCAKKTGRQTRAFLCVCGGVFRARAKSRVVPLQHRVCVRVCQQCRRRRPVRAIWGAAAVISGCRALLRACRRNDYKKNCVWACNVPSLF